MTEELYVIKNNTRYKVDLSVPSGIVLIFNSPLFNDLSKYECSRSFTFNIPMTQNNRMVFDLVDDIRVEKDVIGKQYLVEYSIDGLNIVRKGNIYINKVEDAYSAVMTWDILRGLKTIQESEMTINKLYNLETYTKFTIPNPGGQVIGVCQVEEIGDDPNDKYDDDGSGGGDLTDGDYTPNDLPVPDYD